MASVAQLTDYWEWRSARCQGAYAYRQGALKYRHSHGVHDGEVPAVAVVGTARRAGPFQQLVSADTGGGRGTGRDPDRPPLASCERHSFFFKILFYFY